VIIAPVVVQYTSLGVVELLMAAVLVAILVWAIRTSKRPAETLAEMEPVK